MTGASNLTTTAQTPFRGPAPSRDTWVLAQATPFDKAAWTDRLPHPDWWPPELDDVPTNAKGQPYVDRETVFAIASNAYVDELHAARAWVASTVWGTGLKQVARFSKPLRQDALQRLTDALTTLRNEGSLAAYAMLHPHPGCGGPMPHLGPAFSTKLLYFVGFQIWDADLPPLILDRRVATALTHVTKQHWLDWGWSPKQYESYLRLAQHWATNWGTTPDVIERVLFSIGGSDRLALTVLTAG